MRGIVGSADLRRACRRRCRHHGGCDELGACAQRSRVSRPGGKPTPRRRARARRRCLVHGAGIGRARLARPEERQDEARRPRRGLGASRRHRRPRRSPVDHRRRAQRNRPRRSADETRPPLSAAGFFWLRQPEHGCLRSPRDPLVHRSERDLRAARPEGRPRPGLPRTARGGAVRHHDDTRRRRLLRLAGGELPRADRHRARNGTRDPAADRRSGRSARVVGLEGADLDQRMERRQGRHVHPVHGTLAGMAPAGRLADALRRSSSTSWTTSG